MYSYGTQVLQDSNSLIREYVTLSFTFQLLDKPWQHRTLNPTGTLFVYPTTASLTVITVRWVCNDSSAIVSLNPLLQQVEVYPIVDFADFNKRCAKRDSAVVTRCMFFILSLLLVFVYCLPLHFFPPTRPSYFPYILSYLYCFSPWKSSSTDVHWCYLRVVLSGQQQ